MRDGITKITDETKALTFSAFEYGKEDTVESLDSRFYDGVLHDSRKELRERIEYYGKISSNSNNGMGYGGTYCISIQYTKLYITDYLER